MTPLSDQLLESIAAEAVREGLADALFTRLATPIGRLLVVQGPRGIVRIGFQEEREDAVLADVARVVGPRVLRTDGELAEVREALAAYLEGETTELDLAYDLSLVRSDFRRRVLEALQRDVPRGRTVSYAALAERIGHPRAARAAGSACARNPVPIVVPCHRVLPGGGGVGNYGGGAERKRRLLELEGALPGGRRRESG